MASNFTFLKDKFNVLYQIGSLAEQHLYSDPNASIIKLRLFGETIVNLMLQLDEIPLPLEQMNAIDRITILDKYDLLPDDIKSFLHQLRREGNKAVHGNYGNQSAATPLLEVAYHLGVWFFQAYFDPKFTPQEFSLNNISSLQNTIEVQEKLIDSLKREIEQYAQTALTQQKITTISKRSRENQIVSSKLQLTENETRVLINHQLCQVGWEADSTNIRYSKGLRPQKGRNLAIAEWPTEGGAADYALFIGEKLYGIIEAKKSSKNISAIIQNQCKEYATTITVSSEQMLGQWGKYKVPFLFASNGKKYVAQLEALSGIWFCDVRDSSHIPYALQGWPSPQRLVERFEKDIATANQKLGEISYSSLEDPSGLGLRYYQIDAIKAVEKAISAGQDKILLAMATGTGKTRTVLGMIYRFLNSGRFRRILFLVDRTALGKQTSDVFKDVKIERVMPLNDIYKITDFSDTVFDEHTRVHIATVQSFVRKILYDDDKKPSSFDYDLIVIDEAHRGYILDKDMDEQEQLYREHNDYISKYRAVIDYFDAVKIGLTATPAKHTTEIFGESIYTYSYRRAVIDGCLADHDMPYHLKTKLNTEGIQYKKGDETVKIDPLSNEIDTSHVSDDLNFDVDQFNRIIISENFTKTCLEEISKHIDPTSEGKTLIFAVNNTHADMIVKVLQDIYQVQGVASDAILKITGNIGDSDLIDQKIRQFKYERFPNIVVTVDLLTTGIDVPEICNIVFMRCVKSRVLYEQMIGRATRKCDHIKKECFHIFDPVRIFEYLEDVSNMKPVVTNPKTPFSALIEGLDIEGPSLAHQIDQIKAKLNRYSSSASKEKLDRIEEMTQKTLSQIRKEMLSLSTQDAKEYIINNMAVFNILDDTNKNKRPLIISHHEDELISIEQSYGSGVKPSDYIEEFAEYVRQNRDKIDALNIACTKPSSMTKKQLRELRIILDDAGFSETQLNSAWNHVKNCEITLDIISLIRAQILHLNLIDKKEKIKLALFTIKKRLELTKIQEGYLDKIGNYLVAEPNAIANKEIFDDGALKEELGPYQSVNKRFDDKLDDVIEELAKFLYEGEYA